MSAAPTAGMTPPEHPGEPRRDATVAPPRPRPTRNAWIGFGVLLAVSIVLLTVLVGSIWQPLFIAAVLASALHGWHERLAVKLGARRHLSAILFTIGAVLLILAPLAAMATVVVKEALGAIDFVTSALDQGGIGALIDRLPGPLHDLAQSALSAVSQRQESIVERAASGGLAAAGAVTTAVSRTTSMIVDTMLMLIGLYFLLADGPRLSVWITDVAPLQGRQMRELFDEMGVVIKSVVSSTLLTALIQGATATVGYALAHVPQAIFFGILTFFAAFIPSIGTALVALPLVGLLFVQGHPWAALFLLGWEIVAVGLVDNLIRPLLIKGGAAMHGAVVFFALIAGLTLFGAAGLVAGPLTVALFVAVIRMGKRDFKSA